MLKTKKFQEALRESGLYFIKVIGGKVIAQLLLDKAFNLRAFVGGFCYQMEHLEKQVCGSE